MGRAVEQCGALRSGLLLFLVRYYLRRQCRGRQLDLSCGALLLSAGDVVSLLRAKRRQVAGVPLQ